MQSHGCTSDHFVEYEKWIADDDSLFLSVHDEEWAEERKK